MSRTRKTYPPEFKAEAVRLVREDGMGVARVAASLGVDRTLVRDWVRRADEAALAGTPAATTVASMADELSRLRRENAVLREEREILNKAAVSASGQGNTAQGMSKCVAYASTFLGRRLSRSAIASRSLCDSASSLVPFGRYWRTNPLVFSLVPRCHGLLGSQK